MSDSELLPALADRIVGARVGAPSGFYVTGEDHLRITTRNSNSSVTLTIAGRLLLLSGRIVPFNERVVPNTDRTDASVTHALAEGWLLDVQVRVASATPYTGQCYAWLELVRGATGALTPLATLTQGYVTVTSPLTWPGGRPRSSLEGVGNMRSVPGTNPAAGVEIVETVPTNARWIIHAVSFSFVTSATVAARRVQIVLDDGATAFYIMPGPADQTASQNLAYQVAAVGFSAVVGAEQVIPFPSPPPALIETFRIRTSTTNLQAGDDFGAPQLLIEEWIGD